MEAVASDIWDQPAYNASLPATTEWLDSNWRDFLVGPDMESHEPFSYPGIGSGIYFLWAPDDSLMYVGQSCDVDQRMMMHMRYGHRFATYGAIKVPPPALFHVEYAYVYALRPCMNLKYERQYWAGHQVMVNAINEVWMPRCVNAD